MKFPIVFFVLFASRSMTPSMNCMPEDNSHDDEENVPTLRILYQSKDLAVVAKPALVPCHWPEYRNGKTRKLMRPQQQNQDSDDEDILPVLQRAIATFPDQPTIRLVHRLDAATSGCLLLAFSSDATRELQQQWMEQTEKTYYALCRGDGKSLRERGPFVADGPVKDSKGIMRESETEIEGLWGSNGNPRRCCLVRAKPKTGRWHQIRQHLGRENFPILSENRHHPDKRENKAWRESFWTKHNYAQRLCLHCQRLRINVIPDILPNGLDVSCPLPEDMQAIIDHTDWSLEAREVLPELFSLQNQHSQD